MLFGGNEEDKGADGGMNGRLEGFLFIGVAESPPRESSYSYEDTLALLLTLQRY